MRLRKGAWSLGRSAEPTAPVRHAVYDPATRLLTLQTVAVGAATYTQVTLLDDGTYTVTVSVTGHTGTVESASFRAIVFFSCRVPDGSPYERPVPNEIAEKGIYVCPTFGVGQRAQQWMEEQGIENPFAAHRHTRIDNLRKLWDTGVKFVSGNDAGVTMTRFDDFQLDLELLVEHVGASSAQAIRTGTSQAAEAIGSDDFGSLAPGKRADILAVRGNAMDDLSLIHISEPTRPY